MKRKTILKEAGVLLVAAILILTALFVFTPLTKVVKASLENFEVTNGGFIAGGFGTCWEWGVPTSGPMGAHSGSKLWATVLAGTYPVGRHWLDSPEIIVSAGANLQWWQWYYVESSYDGGNVKISAYPYASWNLLTPVGGYPSIPNSANPLYPDRIFTGSHKYWEQKTVASGDLISYVGQKVKIRFDFGADTSVSYAGWYIDDVDLPVVLNSPLKWEQLPDTNQTGIDIMVSQGMGQFNRTLADDFKCTSIGLITDVHLWGSWLNDIKGSIAQIHLSIHADIKAQNNTPSMPGGLLWQRDFYQGDFTETLYLNNSKYEWWWDPYTYTLYPNCDHNIWQLDINIPKNNSFIQNGTVQNPVIYWLDVSVDSYNGSFGWKTANTHWNDDAVRYNPQYAPPWQELRYPYGHAYVNQSIDMAFRITTTVQECCFGITWPTYGETIKDTRFEMNITELCNENHADVPWSLKIINNGPGPIRCLWPWTPLYAPGFRLYSYTISSISANSHITVYSPKLWAAIFATQPPDYQPRSITIIVTVDDCSSVTQTATLSWIPGVGRMITIP